MNVASLLVSLVTGAVGGNAAGYLLKKYSLGTLVNSLAGILGGGLGGSILQMLGIAAAPSGGFDCSQSSVVSPQAALVVAPS